ncbi:hypothetical protein GCM10009593_06750 [Microlunatus antarcticus]
MIGAAAVVLVVLLVLLVRCVTSGPASSSGPSAGDAEVLVTDVELPQTDPAYTVASVVAVVQGDRAFLRVSLIWPDDDTELHQVPLMGATVTHHAPYAGLTAACGLTDSVAPPRIEGPATLELSCTGLLVPADVATVELTD